MYGALSSQNPYPTSNMHNVFIYIRDVFIVLKLKINYICQSWIICLLYLRVAISGVKDESIDRNHLKHRYSCHFLTQTKISRV